MYHGLVLRNFALVEIMLEFCTNRLWFRGGRPFFLAILTTRPLLSEG